MPADPRRADPFAPLAPVLAGLRQAPLPPVLTISGDDDWIVAEAVRRAVAVFRESFREGEVSSYEGPAPDVKEAVADAATVALFSTNRLVTLDASELLRARKLSADEVDALLDEAGDLQGAALLRVAKKAHGLAAAAGVDVADDPADAARRLTGRVKRSERAAELATLLALPADDGEAKENALDRLLDYVARARAGDNALLVHAISPDAEHHAARPLLRVRPAADLAVSGEAARRDRLVALGLERAIERGAAVEPEVFDTLTERGRLEARGFLSELDRLIDSAPGSRVTAEAAARLVVDERKEYGSDFVEAVSSRRFVEALAILERLLSGDDFSAFRPFGGKDEVKGPRKGPRGEAAFFPLLGLLAGEVRRMLSLRAAAEERGLAGPRRPDYRTFVDRVLPGLKAPRPGTAPIPLDGHPFVLHKAFTASLDWPLPELAAALLGIEAIDRGVKSGAGTGRELLESFLLARAVPGRRS